MLTKRIIPCLDIKDGRTVKGVNFINLIDAGDPVELAAKYAQLGADELVFLDISATLEKRKTLVSLVEKIAQRINIPFTVGGGVTSVEDASSILMAGADKIAINSAAVKRPELINELADTFGNQCIVVATDAKNTPDGYKVFIGGGKVETDKELLSWTKEVVSRGAGEILYTSMDCDGTKNGFAIEPLNKLCQAVNVPVIASGGAGEIDHFIDVFKSANVDAALAASVFHFGEIEIPALKESLKKQEIPIRL
ncbi:imidazole glycerol phosphate synthase subunit HisF [Paracrocinitomix mangrovi]|uniref:imidazole glycerol phosphate synthase subunit HisF n=1 Tax=Paracrocinitomix mangrovi TaxID=2862509 RepID=UPI001C8EA9FB|nr:imidazole glycerol phosphate synthase subunit HisF [Paracrocinitomix mangrovi]UKN02296.1 imidazole glycerol phosphate synthase subunit HisF [Paracrocinitomix mangrovi]